MCCFKECRWLLNWIIHVCYITSPLVIAGMSGSLPCSDGGQSPLLTVFAVPAMEVRVANEQQLKEKNN